MKLAYRFIVFLLITIFTIMSVVLALYSFGLSTSSSLAIAIEKIHGRWELGLLFILFFAAGIWIISPFFLNEKRTTLISRTELGDADITLEALDQLVTSVALQQEGVVDIENTMKTEDEGLVILLKASVCPRNPIPELVNELQLLVKSYIQDTTGVNVNKVKIVIEDVCEEEQDRKEE